MNTYKLNFSKLLNSAVLTLFLLSSTAAFAGAGPEEEKPSTPAIQMKAPSSLPSPEKEVAPAPSAHATPSLDELQLQELQRKAEIARLQRQIAEDEAATRAATLLGQQKAAPQPDLLGPALLGAFRGGRSDARVQRNLNKLGLGEFGSFLGLPHRK